jgi:putative oxidoreductase
MKNNSGVDAKGYGIALLRAVTGAVFLAHGVQKLFIFGHPGVTGVLTQIGIPLPGLAAWAIALTEFLGGIALLLGLFTRWAAVPLAFGMLVAILTVHLSGGFFAPKGIEYPLTMLAISLALLLTGSGALALDNVFFGGRRRGGDVVELREAA